MQQHLAGDQLAVRNSKDAPVLALVVLAAARLQRILEQRLHILSDACHRCGASTTLASLVTPAVKHVRQLNISVIKGTRHSLPVKA